MHARKIVRKASTKRQTFSAPKDVKSSNFHTKRHTIDRRKKLRSSKKKFEERRVPGVESAVSAVRFLVRNRCRRWAQESPSSFLGAAAALATAARVNTTSTGSSLRTEAGGGARHSRSGAPMARHAPTIARTTLTGERSATRIGDWAGLPLGF